MRMEEVGRYLLWPSIFMVLSGCNVPGQAQNDEGDLVASQRLVQVKAAPEFEAYLKRGLAESVASPSTLESTTEVVISTAALDASTGGSYERVSATNVQVGGVDEGDLIKSDGRYLYAVSQPVYGYMPPSDRVSPVVDVAVVEPGLRPSTSTESLTIISPEEVEQIKPAAIRVLAIQSDPAFSEQIGRIEIPEGKGRFNSLYLASGEATQKDLLVAIGDGGNSWGWGDWSNPWFWQRGSVNVWGYDVSDPSQIESAYSLDIDGYLLTSRRIGDTLYLVTRYTPHIPDYLPYQSSDAQREQNQALLEAASVESLLPKIRVNGGEPQNLVSPTRCFLPAEAQRRHYSPSVITLTAINVREPEKRQSVCYGGDSFSFYASTQNFYLTRSDYGYMPLDTSAMTSANSPRGERTYVHKFALKEGGVAYEASGQVVGTIRSSHPSFMMSEREGLFYIVTSNGFGAEIKHRLTVLAQKGHTLQEYAVLPNEQRPAAIGKPGERLYASRFIDDKAYLVTFRNIDPLYVLDLSDPKDPYIAGELEMPGYSGYLHPVAGDRLLGVGQDASEEGRLRGIKVSLFDIADMSQPREINAIVLGDSGTHTPLLYDHLALSYLAGEKGEPDRFAFPVSLYKRSILSETPWSRWVHDGLYLFDIEEELHHRGVVVGADASTGGRGQGVYGDRAVIQGSAVHYVRDRRVISTDWESVIP